MSAVYPAPGDRVHYWRADPPPLCADYVQPPCLPAMIVSSGAGGEFGITATLAVVTEEGDLIVRLGVPRIESHASCGSAPGERSYGVPASWHSLPCGKPTLHEGDSS